MRDVTPWRIPPQVMPRTGLSTQLLSSAPLCVLLARRWRPSGTNTGPDSGCGCPWAKPRPLWTPSLQAAASGMATKVLPCKADLWLLTSSALPSGLPKQTGTGRLSDTKTCGLAWKRNHQGRRTFKRSPVDIGLRLDYSFCGNCLAHQSLHKIGLNGEGSDHVRLALTFCARRPRSCSRMPGLQTELGLLFYGCSDQARTFPNAHDLGKISVGFLVLELETDESVQVAHRQASQADVASC